MSDDAPTPTDDVPSETAAPAKPIPLTKAEKLEAKAAKLREAEAARAEKGESTPSARPLPWMIACAVLALALIASLSYAFYEQSQSNDAHKAASSARKAAATAIATAQAQASAAAKAALSKDQALRDSALQTATTVSASFGTYNYKTLDADFARTRSYLTPSFASNFNQLTDSLGKLITAAKGQTVGTVVGAGIETISSTSATVVVFLDQKVTSAQSSTPRLDHNRLKLTLAMQSDGHWLVSALTLV